MHHSPELRAVLRRDGLQLLDQGVARIVAGNTLGARLVPLAMLIVSTAVRMPAAGEEESRLLDSPLASLRGQKSSKKILLEL
jgi:hypothetical protein